MKIKFTFIDYIIIILVICAIVFAFVHLTTDDSSDLQKTAFDESTVNKIPDTYLRYYKDGFIVKTTVEGFNSTNGNRTTLTGNLIWEDDNGGNNVRLVINSNNTDYLVGLYRTVPDADIYIDHISLESNGEKYKNLCEITAKSKNISSIKDLTNNIPNNTDYELSTTVSLDSLDSNQIMEISNKISEHSKRNSVKLVGTDNNNQIIIKKATDENLKDTYSVLGDISGITNEITIRIYNSTDSQINEISKNYDVINVRKF